VRRRSRHVAGEPTGEGRADVLLAEQMNRCLEDRRGGAVLDVERGWSAGACPRPRLARILFLRGAGSRQGPPPSSPADARARAGVGRDRRAVEEAEALGDVFDEDTWVVIRSW